MFESPISLPGDSMEFGPSGRYFAVAATDGLVHVIDLTKSRESGSFPGEKSATCLRFSPDGQRLAMSARSGDLRVWEWRSGDLVYQWSAPAALHGVAWRSDGQSVAVACEDGNVYLRQLHSDRHVVLKGHRHVATKVAFHPQGRFLLSTSWDGTTRLWDVYSQAEMLRTFGQLNHFSADGDHLSLALDSSRLAVREFDPARECLALYGHHSAGKRVFGSAFSADLPLAATCGDDGVRLWDTTHWREVAFLEVGWNPSAVFPSAYRQFVDGWPTRPV